MVLPVVHTARMGGLWVMADIRLGVGHMVRMGAEEEILSHFVGIFHGSQDGGGYTTLMGQRLMLDRMQQLFPIPQGMVIHTILLAICHLMGIQDMEWDIRAQLHQVYQLGSHSQGNNSYFERR